MAPNEIQDTEDPFGLSEEYPIQVVYTKYDVSSDVSTEVGPSSGSDACQRSRSDIDPSVHTECQSENNRHEVI